MQQIEKLKGVLLALDENLLRRKLQTCIRFCH